MPLILLLFLGSGCAALIYEIVWFQNLQLVLGASAVSLAVLLAAFMGGMCAGSLLLARYIPARGSQMFSGSGMMATMACSVSYAIAAALAFPGRQIVAFTGDGGMSMLLGELATVVRYRLPIKIVVMKNNSLGQIKWEQLMFLGNPEYECDLTPIDFAAAAQAFGITGFRTESPETCGRTLDAALAHDGPALVEATVDPHEPLLPAKRIEKYAANLDKALREGTRDAPEIRQALEREPSRTQLS